MLNKKTKEKLLSDYEPREHRLRVEKEDKVEQSTGTARRRMGSLFRVDFPKVLEKKDHFTFSGFINEFVE